MELLILIIVYFLSIIILLKLSKVIAKIYIKKNYSLERIKFIVWLVLGSIITFLTLTFIFLIVYYFKIISFQVLLVILILLVIFTFLSIIYLIIKLS